MQVNVRMLVVSALLALLVPAAALAASGSEVKGPLTVTGEGYFGGELELSLGDEQRPVQLAGQIGYVGFLDLGGDLRVRCGGGRLTVRRTENGRVFMCQGRVGRVAAAGSHFAFRGHAGRYRLQLPAGASGTLHGPGGTRGGEREDERKEERERNAPLPTLAQLAAMLAAATAG